MSSYIEQVSIKDMSRKQRRVLGVLLEKAFTTPDQYPLTLKAATTGCNQKSNRDPIANYDEDDVLDTLSQLQQRGLVGCLHTEGGRTERYRHYMRNEKVTPKLNEPQLAIMTELMLRGKQQLGELRTRASRMVAIESQEDLRRELQALMDAGLVRANGSLERRGIEVDHDLYPHSENREPLSEYNADESESPVARSSSSTQTSTGHRIGAEETSGSANNDRIGKLESTVSELREELASVRTEFQSLQDRFEDLRRQLGG